MGYYDNGTEQYSEQYSEQYNHHSNPPAIAAPVPVHVRSSTVSSPSLSNGIAAPPSDVFTASSEVSEQDEQQPPVAAAAAHNAMQGQPPQGGSRKQYKQRPGMQKHQKEQTASAATPTAEVKTATPKPSSQPTQTYESAFPALGGEKASTSAPRRWTPAFATRKLRTDAPAWSPGQPTEAFLIQSIQARVAKEHAHKTCPSEGIKEGSQVEVEPEEPAQKVEAEAGTKEGLVVKKEVDAAAKEQELPASSSSAAWSKVLGRKASRA
jgi:hypothetical protein